ncbi:Hypothetical protein PBC10988_29480 [Planctomycetales bacterium 10988]|nr:Hypothetical protein PBC10988_29480 [Planctomycetales bacterium 10988]
MSVEFVEGDIFKTPDEVGLAHGCNCRGMMDAGVAVSFRDRWPEMYQQYKKLCDDGEFNLGEMFVWQDDNTGRTVFNLATQREPGPHASIDALRTAMTKMRDHAGGLQVETIAIPLIGAGIGGLTESGVKDVFTKVFEKSDIRLIVCEVYRYGKNPLA